ncbi:gamma-aminobutyric acid receptor subunit pi isoform X6 [Motacilla alba alba]|uniref:gamma-aminobutyric acid receptor subunit pi isoform X6 n=1 Tax=Motacilla alba alba TaxID=1094192 RepID=UPI0018D59AA9|nr:gamma-aminobutyric acid receptor subunit pi isoform X6 [Motacilla alba alba]
MLKNDTSQEKGQEPLHIRYVKHHSVIVPTVQHFFSLSPSLKIFFPKPQDFVFLFFFTDKQSKYRNNLQICSADIFSSSVCVFSFQPKGALWVMDPACMAGAQHPSLDLRTSPWGTTNTSGPTLVDYTATISLRQRWTDPRLVFHGNKSFTLDARLVELLWVPDTYIVESKRSFLHDVTVGNRLVRLFSNGTVLYALRITATVACNMDLSKYPMDTQICQLQLESWGYDENDVTFIWLRGNNSVHGMEKLRLSQYTVERYHTLVSKSQQETGSYPRLILQFELRRNVLYFILETYVPSTLLVMLSWVSFWITLDSVPARTCIASSLVPLWNMQWLTTAPHRSVQLKYQKRGLQMDGLKKWKKLTSPTSSKILSPAVIKKSASQALRFPVIMLTAVT